MTEGEIYFVKFGEFVKIGWAKNSARRFKELDTANPHDGKILLIIPGDISLEHQIQKRLRKYHHKKEWFRYSPKFMKDVCRIKRKLEKPKEPDEDFLDPWDVISQHALQLVGEGISKGKSIQFVEVKHD